MSSNWMYDKYVENKEKRRQLFKLIADEHREDAQRITNGDLAPIEVKDFQLRSSFRIEQLLILLLTEKK